MLKGSRVVGGCAILGAGLFLLVFRPAGAAGQFEALPSLVQLSGGEFHSCGVTDAGAAWCWGSNRFGQLGAADASTAQRETAVAVSGLGSGVRATSVGREHSCALLLDGSVRCWGRNAEGQLGYGNTTDRSQPGPAINLGATATAIAAGEEQTCAQLGNGQIRCWGRNDLGQLGDGSTTRRTAPVAVAQPAGSATVLAAGAGHACAVIGGVTHCWGRNDSGQIGDGTLTNRTLPTPVSGGLSGVTALAAGRAHTCALTAGGVSCWGSNSDGQLGDGGTASRRVPGAVTGLSGVRRIAANFRHTCALTQAGAALCWGDNFFGQIGDGSDRDRRVPTPVSGQTSGGADIAAGYRHNCVAAEDRLLTRCWGNNFDGQLGNGTFSNRLVPRPTLWQSSGAVRLALGFQHTCAWSAARGTECWGDGTSGQLGDGLGTSSAIPVRVTQLTDGTGVMAGGVFHTCSLTASGGVKCWGENGSGQLGDGSSTDRSTPTAVVGLDGSAIAVTAGGFHSCAVLGNGEMRCWGSNGSGQLGTGNTSSQTTPGTVSGLPAAVVAASAGQSHTCALVTGGAVWCWGANASGQLGDGGTASRPSPAVVVGLESGVVAISVNGDFSCALLGNGQVQCWGDNTFGQLGIGSTALRTTPTPVSGLPTPITALSTSWYHACAIAANGATRCWGRNIEGQVGDNSTLQRTRPVVVSGLAAGTSATYGGGGQGCVVKSDSEVLCWGANNFGQVGDGTTWAQRTPVDVLVDGALPKIAALTPGANGASSFASADRSGRFVLFQSSANTLVGGDGNGAADVFRIDRRSGERLRVSVDNGGREIAGASIEPAMSADAQRIVFVAPDAAVAEVANESTSKRALRQKSTGQAVFLRNMLTGTTQRVGDARPQGTGTKPDIDPNGTTVVWTQPNPAGGAGTPGQDNIYLAALTPLSGGAVAVGPAQCATCKAINANGTSSTVNADGASQVGQVSADGRWLVWQTAAKNVRLPGGGKNAPVCATSSSTIYLRNMLTGTVQEVSAPASGGGCGSGAQSASAPVIDGSGATVAFQSTMPLAAGDQNGVSDVFVWQQGGAPLRRVSTSSNGADNSQPATDPAISDDGRIVAFSTSAGGVDASFADNNDATDVHVASVATGTSARLSRSPSGGEAGASSGVAALSGDGTSVVFQTAAANLALGASAGSTGVVQRPNPLLPALRSGIWWIPSESGWGLFVFEQGGVLAAAWYTYDQDGEPTWFLIPALEANAGRYTGQVLRFTGTPFDRIGNSANAVETVLGNASLQFADGRLDFRYTIGSTTQTKMMQPFPFAGRQMSCAPHVRPSRADVPDYSDIWAGTASGWGVFIVQVDDQLLPSWYTYDTDGEAIFLIAVADRQADGSFRGPLFRQASGTPFLQINGQPPSPASTQVGEVSFRFSDGENGTFSYTVGAVAQTKSIRRLPFGPTPSACSTQPAG